MSVRVVIRAGAERDIRRAALRTFPYLVWYVYLEESETVHILAVSHQRQGSERTRQSLL